MRRIILILLMLLFGIVVFFMSSSSPNNYSFDNSVAARTGSIKTYSPGDTLDVMTYNIGYLSGMTNNLPLERSDDFIHLNQDHLLDFLANQNPDLIGFQEIDFDAERSYHTNQAALIIDRLDYAANYLSVNWNKRYVPFPYWPISAHFGSIVSGQGIMSRFALHNSETITLDRPKGLSYFYDSYYLDRLIQVVDVVLGTDTIKLMNVHLEAFDTNTRVETAHIVKDLFNQHSDNMPVLIIGDFNSQPEYVDDEDAMSIIMSIPGAASAIGETQYLNNPNENFTFSSRNPRQMIDFIIYNTNFIEPIATEVLQEAGEISDHYPVRMQFIIKPENAGN